MDIEIPLTIEIVEKNFGRGGGLGWYDVFDLSEDNDFWNNKYIALRDAHRYPNKCRFAIIINDKENVFAEIKTVRELQHALQTLGIKKNIIL